jgi:DeoR/GlpR family transcriptional regulator of sugar metabolism
MEAVSKRFVLADSSKLGVKGAAVTATCEQLDCLITDSALDSAIVTEFQQSGLEVVLV